VKVYCTLDDDVSSEEAHEIRGPTLDVMESTHIAQRSELGLEPSFHRVPSRKSFPAQGPLTIRDKPAAALAVVMQPARVSERDTETATSSTQRYTRYACEISRGRMKRVFPRNSVDYGQMTDAGYSAR
jgi:hypothetical protein